MATTTVMADITLPYDILSRKIGERTARVSIVGLGQMPHVVVNRMQTALNDCGKPVRNSHLTVMGVAYKSGIEDVRESSAPDIIHLLQERGVRVTYSDANVPHLRADGLPLNSQAETCSPGIAS